MRKILIALLLSSGLDAAAGAVRHDLKVALSPAEGRLLAEDRVSFPEPRREFVFSLHKGLSPSSPDGALEPLTSEAAARYGINYSSAAPLYQAYRLAAAKPLRSFSLAYAGEIKHALGETAEEYARSFSETPGLISADGCYLAASSGWYPQFEGELVSFRLETSLPAPFLAVAGGARTAASSAGGVNRAVWETALPHDEITLACGPYTEYSRAEGGRSYHAFLRSPDKALADKYLDASSRYVRLYSDLLGPYPYPKFALVENFWETGYGIPSFTLLGPKVIRLPFILNSSYPHEILHNWWGNGVFVDYASGNWCEGLTAYLADYLIAEHRGKGREYRVSSLQKYSDYVRGGADFPLTEFRSRHSSASEAIGYGKALMVYHMLRRALGDENFRKGLRGFYAANLGRAASFSDLRAAFEKVTGAGRLAGFFQQWTRRAGAPELRLAGAKVRRGALEGYDMEFTVEQVQPGPAYGLDIPAAIYLEGSAEPRMKTLRLDARSETYHYSAPLRPVRVELDPEFDVFRKLSPLETPPTLSRLLGAKHPGLILPAGGAGAPWQALASAWTKDKENLPEVSDDKAGTPAAASYWVLGGENGLAPAFEAALERYGAKFSADAVTLGNRRFARASHTFVFADFHPADPALAAALVLSGTPEKLPLLAAKLPHYGKYSWLVFDAGMNSAASGVWENSRSPLAADLAAASPAKPGPYPRRAPLAAPPSAFSAENIIRDASYLASRPGGRSPGSSGHRQAAAFIEGEFRKAGLKPFTGTSFRSPETTPGRANLLGLKEGSGRKGEYVVLCAHYDHLPAKNGGVFPGADDNASGTALLLELARRYAARSPERSIIFAAFDGEEEGRQGSKAFLAGLPETVKLKLNAALNFDTVGRLGAGKVLVLGASSSNKWVHVFRGAGFVTGTEYELVKEPLDASDQQSFIEAGVPAVQFFSGPNADYHKTSDTPDKLDAAGMVKQAEFAAEIIDYLAGESDQLTRPAGAPALPGAQAGERRASTGLVPDFSFPGPGVRAQDITPGSPLAAAGLKAGDVITAINGEAATDLRAYSAALKKLSPGQKVSVAYLSDGAEKTAEIELAGR